MALTVSTFLNFVPLVPVLNLISALVFSHWPTSISMTVTLGKRKINDNQPYSKPRFLPGGKFQTILLGEGTQRELMVSH